MNLTQHLTAPLRMAGRSRDKPSRQNIISVDTPGIVTGGGTAPETAQKLSAVFAAVDIRSNSMSVLPAYVYDSTTREHIPHSILRLLSERPNEAMTPAEQKKLIETWICLQGKAGEWIIRDPRTYEPVELIPVPGNLIQQYFDDRRYPWYIIQDPVTHETFRVPGDDFCYYPGPNGGKSVLSYAADTIRAGLAAQSYNADFYESGGQPSGLLTVETDLSGYVQDKNGNNTDVTKKEALRREWEKAHSGPTNAHRIAVLDFGMKYQPLSINHKDSQFIEQQAVTVLDICRYFGVPPYKLFTGNQSYNANEQNSIEYLTNLQPRITQKEEEQTYKLLFSGEKAKGLEIRYNMMAALRSDSKSRSAYYRDMGEAGFYSVNEVRALEDMPDTPGGDEHMASLNYVPLSVWKELSIRRNGGGGE